VSATTSRPAAAPADEASAAPGTRPVSAETLRTGVLLALVATVAEFLHVLQFGLYEDDYFFIAQAMGQSPAYLGERLRVFQRWTQGRPIGFFLPDLLSFVGDKLGGLPGIYALGFLVVVLNATLFFVLLRRRQPYSVALLGALGFVLFPADTTKVLLTHAFQLQPSLTFLLLASIAYLDGRRLAPYVLIVGSLLSYESPFVVFFGIPLLAAPWSRATPRQLARHAATLVGILALGVLVRVLVGESRAVGATVGVAELVPRIVGSMVLGPTRALLLFFYGPLKAVPTWGPEITALALLSAASLFLVLRRLASPRPLSAGEPPRQVASPRLQLLGSGVVLLVLAYALAFTHYPPTAVAGRSTSVHLAAAVGGATIFAAVASAMLSLNRGWRPYVSSALVALYLALLVGYQMTIQRDFVSAWDMQKELWSQVAACCSDLQDGTVLVFETDNPPTTPFIGASSWADPLVLPLLYRFPATWQQPPRLFTLAPGWTGRVERAGAGWRWLVPGATWDEHQEPLAAGNVIVLRQENGRLVRLPGPLVVGGEALPLKPEAPAPAWPPGPLHRILLGT